MSRSSFRATSVFTRKLVVAGCVSPIMWMAMAQANAAPWVRGFVIDKYEPAFHYGARTGTMDPGADCPLGTIPDNDYRVVLKTSWRSDAEVSDIIKAASPDANGTYRRDGQFLLNRALQHRGFRKDIDSWVNPFAAPDPGMQEVTGRIAEGFNLDNNSKTGEFISSNGERGIDNSLYRAWGCIMSYRGLPYTAYLSMRANDKMLEGLYTMVVRISGNQDPLNDDNATVEIGYSPDRVFKDASGGVAPKYSFRLAKSAQYTRLGAKIKNGVLDTKQVPELKIPSFAWFENNRGEVIFQQGKIRLTIGADGNMSGMLGGYRDWRDVYAKDTFDAGAGAGTRETFYHENQIAKYYALKRNADGLPDPKTGEKWGISAAYRFTARPAHIIDPAIPAEINEPVTSKSASVSRSLFIKAVSNKSIVAGPVSKQAAE